ncbi:MAG: imidazoleglycerol-phosphate dehydratase [Vampirovibrionales bacterium]
MPNTLPPRSGTRSRKTGETDIQVSWHLDAPEKVNIQTPLPFFNHMISALAKHGRFGIEITAHGDTDVDPHHLVEDTGIVMGQALFIALGEHFSGIERSGFFHFPMDGTLAQVSIDLCGRPNLVWNVPQFESATVGLVDPRLFREFFKGFVDGLNFTLHVNVPYRDNDHHVIESIFKAFTKALRQSVSPVYNKKGEAILMSTKEAIEAPKML